MLITLVSIRAEQTVTRKANLARLSDLLHEREDGIGPPGAVEPYTHGPALLQLAACLLQGDTVYAHTGSRGGQRDHSGQACTLNARYVQYVLATRDNTSMNSVAMSLNVFTCGM